MRGAKKMDFFAQISYISAGELISNLISSGHQRIMTGYLNELHDLALDSHCCQIQHFSHIMRSLVCL